MITGTFNFRKLSYLTALIMVYVTSNTYYGTDSEQKPAVKPAQHPVVQAVPVVGPILKLPNQEQKINQEEIKKEEEGNKLMNDLNKNKIVNNNNNNPKENQNEMNKALNMYFNNNQKGQKIFKKYEKGTGNKIAEVIQEEKQEEGDGSETGNNVTGTTRIIGFLSGLSNYGGIKFIGSAVYSCLNSIYNFEKIKMNAWYKNWYILCFGYRWQLSTDVSGGFYDININIVGGSLDYLFSLLLNRIKMSKVAKVEKVEKDVSIISSIFKHGLLLGINLFNFNANIKIKGTYIALNITSILKCFLHIVLERKKTHEEDNGELIEPINGDKKLNESSSLFEKITKEKITKKEIKKLDFNYKDDLFKKGTFGEKSNNNKMIMLNNKKLKIKKNNKK